jgi:hypothetical protein
MMEERYYATTQNRFYPDMSNINNNITVEEKHISPPTYYYIHRENDLGVLGLYVLCVVCYSRNVVAFREMYTFPSTD